MTAVAEALPEYDEQEQPPFAVLSTGNTSAVAGEPASVGAVDGDEEVAEGPDIPDFEGKPVASTTLKLTGLTGLDNDPTPNLVVGVDDRIRIVVEVRVTSVGVTYDAKGQLRRDQVAKVITATRIPFDPSDPDDDGIIRA